MEMVLHRKIHEKKKQPDVYAGRNGSEVTGGVTQAMYGEE